MIRFRLLVVLSLSFVVHGSLSFAVCSCGEAPDPKWKASIEAPTEELDASIEAEEEEIEEMVEEEVEEADVFEIETSENVIDEADRDTVESAFDSYQWRIVVNPSS